MGNRVSGHRLALRRFNFASLNFHGLTARERVITIGNMQTWANEYAASPKADQHIAKTMNEVLWDLRAKYPLQDDGNDCPDCGKQPERCTCGEELWEG